MPSLTNGNGSRPLYWRSEEQLKDSDRFRHWLDHEFPEVEEEANGDNPLKSSVSRRSFLGVMGASMALAGFTGCRKPVEKIVPYVTDPEYRVQGVPRFFATAQPRGTAPLSILVETHQGRPTKVEGNELHPSSGGGVDSFGLASVLDLYDPDRSKYPTQRGARRSMDEFIEFWRELHTGFIETGGEGLAILSETFASPSLWRLREKMRRDLPNARWVAYEPVNTENRDRGLERATGKKVQPVYRYDRAEVVVSIDNDFILSEPDAVRHNGEFGRGRKLTGPDDSMNRLYVVESAMSVTGGKADHRLRLQSHQIGAFLISLTIELEKQGLTIPGSGVIAGRAGEKFETEFAGAIAEDLYRHRGKALVTVGLRQPPAVHALALAINTALGNNGRTVLYREYEDTLPSSLDDLKTLAEDMRGGKVNTLVVFGGDPVYNAPADVRFAPAFAKVENRIHFGGLVNATARASHWHVSRSHFMEAWGDVRATNGILSIIQPQIAPLYDTRGDVEFANLIITGLDTSSYELVRETWFDSLLHGDKERSWQIALHDGLLESSRDNEGGPVVVDGGEVAFLLRHTSLHAQPITDGSYEVVFIPSGTVHDGRYANNAWLVELPDPVTKNTWGNTAVMSTKTAEKLGVGSGDVVAIELNGRTVQLPAYVQPGHADQSITIELGWGQSELGRVAKDSIGVDVYPLRTSETMGFARGATVARTGGYVDLPNTQDHGAMEGRAIVREATMETYKHDTKFAQHMVHVPNLDSLWKEHTYQEGYQWGMAIDLNACTNCNACVTACQSENNIPVVGKDRVRVGREMHWMRMDRYYVGDVEEARVANQPMMCQHCEMAPCEQVCPVNATVHDSEGLNVMTYNRCIGTRYCSNNCPYKVRRFNFFNFTNEFPDSVKMAQNPDVTVRSRGVMEKCTFCLQRINLAKQKAKAEGRTVEDGDFQTACQQACPPNAIVFGNINDPNSEVSKLRKNTRAYGVLEEFNTRPRVLYLAGVLNPNPKLKPVAVEVEPHGTGHGGGHGENGHSGGLDTGHAEPTDAHGDAGH
ncbi:TAT-variant-translocated molybdopterin oxidoreductase [bacterium]|nr:TAT-variant-translocated molybdopterin oxidoreductase [bacterium]